METDEREGRRKAITEMLWVQAQYRFGAEQAEALRPAIAEAASQLAQVANFPLDRDDRPAFNLNRPE